MKLNEWINKKFWQSIFTRLSMKNEYSLKIQRSQFANFYLDPIGGKATAVLFCTKYKVMGFEAGGRRQELETLYSDFDSCILYLT